jgi:hypothetical protein
MKIVIMRDWDTPEQRLKGARQIMADLVARRRQASMRGKSSMSQNYHISVEFQQHFFQFCPSV